MTKGAVTESEERRYAELQALALDLARRGETEMLVEMVAHGLPVNLSDARGNSLLMLASYNGNLETARRLLDRGADVDRRNDRGQTPLGAGVTPIMYAAVFGRTSIVGLLQRKGAALGRRSRLGLSAGTVVRWTRWVGALRRLFHSRRSSGG